jgi:DNA-binding LytR/AlgR family response regulator
MVSVLDNSRKHWFRDEKPDIVTKNDFHLVAGNGKDVFSAKFEDILVFHSSGNYIEIYWLDNQIIRKKLFRQSFAVVEQIVSLKQEFVKCHRCWIVNLKKIKALTGNSKGYFVEINKLEFRIPVSRHHITSFRKLVS